MINNSSARARAFGAFVIASVACAACGRRPAPPVEYQGIIELDERVLAFEVAGRVDAISVRRGDSVEPGKALAKLDDTLERLARRARADEASMASADLALLEAGARREDVGAVGAEVSGAVAAETLARKNLERARTLAETGAIAKGELDRAEAELERATAQRRSLEQRLQALRTGTRPQEIARGQAREAAARAALALADARLERYALTSSIAGLVVDVHLEPGELAAAGTPALTVADVAHPQVDVFVPQGELDGIRVGTKASVRVDGTTGPSRTSGVVEHVSPSTEYTPRYLFSEKERALLVVRVRVRLEDPQHQLHAGVPAFARFER